MIKFFRRFRQSMLTNGKFSNYLFYAIGEIALVMIGILLALQVNNWNEARTDKKNEVTILKQLNQDLKVNLIELSDYFDGIVNRNNSGLKLLKHLESGKPFNDSVLNWTTHYGSRNIFNNANTTYKNLESSQKNIISNDSLRLRITMMYEYDFSNVHTREKSSRDVFLLKFKNELHENFKIGASKASWLPGKFADINTPRDWKTLRENDDFKNVLIDLYNFRLIRINWLGETLKDLKILIEDIDNEITKLE